MSGFTSGAALHALTSQLPLVFGVKAKRQIRGLFKLPKIYLQLIPSLYYDINLMSTGIALISIVALYVAKELNDRYKSTIGVVLPNELILVRNYIFSRKSPCSCSLAHRWHSGLSLRSASVNTQCVRRRSHQTRSSLAKRAIVGQTRPIDRTDHLPGHRQFSCVDLLGENLQSTSFVQSQFQSGKSNQMDTKDACPVRRRNSWRMEWRIRLHHSFNVIRVPVR